MGSFGLCRCSLSVSCPVDPCALSVPAQSTLPSLCAGSWHLMIKLSEALPSASGSSLQHPRSSSPEGLSVRAATLCAAPPAILPRGVRVDGAHSGANRGRRTTNDAEKMVLNKLFSLLCNVILIQLLGYNSVRTYPLVILVVVVCPTEIFLSDFFYSGALLVH